MTEPTLPDFDIVRALFLLQCSSDNVPLDEKTSIADNLLSKIIEKKQSMTYQLFCEKTSRDVDSSVEASLSADNADELARLEAAIATAEESFGDIEVKGALLAKADFFMRIGDKGLSLSTLEAAYKKTVGVGMKIDNLLTRARVGFYHGDLAIAKDCVDEASKELEKGGDWERKNRLLVYRGLLHMTKREFKEAANLFVATLATFTSTELLSFNEFVLYTVITACVSLDRSTLKNKLLNSPEILSISHEIPGLTDFLSALHESRYSDFFASILTLSSEISKDRYLSSHLRFLLRSFRLIAFKQFLTSYKSVTIANMAAAFAISQHYLDLEISSFVANGKLNCKIDQVAGVVESRVGDERNEAYLKVIKNGDALLNRMQKLGKVIDL